MRRLLLLAAVAAAFATPSAAHAKGSICDDSGCGPIARCHYWTDYPLCIY